MNERLEKEKISKLLLSMAIPAILAQLATLIYNMVDRIYIGQLPDGSLGIAGIGLCTSIITIITAFTNLFGRGGAPLASIHMGEKRTDLAERIMGNCFFDLVISSIIITVILLVFGEDLLFLFGASENTIRYAMDYMGIYCLGTLFVQLSVGMNYFINAQGYTKFGMLTLMIGGVLNIILDPIFIFVLGLGCQRGRYRNGHLTMCLLSLGHAVFDRKEDQSENTTSIFSGGYAHPQAGVRLRFFSLLYERFQKASCRYLLIVSCFSSAAIWRSVP